MSGVANGDGSPVRDLFGVTLPDGTGATGTAGDRTPPPDEDVPGGRSGLPGVGTAVPLGFQAGPGESASTSQPGQTAASVISPGPAADYASAGPRPSRQHTDAWPRYGWQQEPGG